MRQIDDTAEPVIVDGVLGQQLHGGAELGIAKRPCDTDGDQKILRHHVVGVVVRSPQEDCAVADGDDDVAGLRLWLGAVLDQFCTPGLIDRASAVIAAISNFSSSTVIKL